MLLGFASEQDIPPRRFQMDNQQKSVVYYIHLLLLPGDFCVIACSLNLCRGERGDLAGGAIWPPPCFCFLEIFTSFS